MKTWHDARWGYPLLLMLLAACGSGSMSSREELRKQDNTPAATASPIPTALAAQRSSSSASPSNPSAEVVSCRDAPTGECFRLAFQHCDLTQQATVTVRHPATTDPSGNITMSRDTLTVEQDGTTCAIRDDVSVDVLRPNGTHGGAAAVGRCTRLSYSENDHLLRFQGCSRSDMDVIVP
jgi:hypothetical protein